MWLFDLHGNFLKAYALLLNFQQFWNYFQDSINTINSTPLFISSPDIQFIHTVLGTDMHGVGDGDGVPKTSQLFLMTSTQQPWGLTGMFTTIYSSPFFKKSSKSLGMGTFLHLKLALIWRDFQVRKGLSGRGNTISAGEVIVDLFQKWWIVYIVITGRKFTSKGRLRH